MKIFIDSADLEELQKAYASGIVEGVTTNPSLIKKSVEKNNVKGMEVYIKNILLLAKGTPVSIEVTKTDFEGMIFEAKKLYKLFNHIAKNVCIKIPVNTAIENSENQFEAIRVIKELNKLRIPVNATLVFTPEQALLAAKAGAKYVSPFAGRLDDYIRTKNNIHFDKKDYYEHQQQNHLDDEGITSGLDLVEKCVSILKKHDLKTEVIAASIRNKRQVRECALKGCHIATIPLDVFEELFKHQQTIEGIKKFKEDTVKEYEEL